MLSVKSFSSAMNLPDIYFEFTSDDFSVAPRRIIDHGAPLCDLWETKRIFRIFGGHAGCYLAYDLHKTPHYQRPYSMRSMIEKKAQEKGLKVEEVDTSDFEEKDYLYHYSHKSSVYTKYVHPRINEFQLPHVIQMLDKEEVCSRGNVAKSIGWRTIDYEYNNKDKINIPTRYPISAFDRSIMKTMTSLVQEIFAGRIDPCPFSGDDIRKKKFAESLLKMDTEVGEEVGSNCFESITYAMSYVGKEDHLLAPHIDQFNCASKGYNMVFSVYFHTNHPSKKNTLVRVVFIGYSRRQMNEYFQRLSLRKKFKENLMKYSSVIGIRNTLSIEKAFPHRKEGEHQFFYSLPFTDKCAFYSIFTSAIYDLSKAFHHVSRPISFDDILELALPVVWLPTGFYYYQILKEWESKKVLPTYNLTMAVVDHIVQSSGGLSKGNGQRFMPFCNKPIPKNRVIESLRKLRKILHESKTGDWSANDLLNGIKDAVYCCGDIGAQHLMSVLTLLGIIKDSKFVRDTVVLKNTMTEKRLKKLYKMSHNVINILYKEVANELYNGNTRMVENLTCEFFRDMGKKVLNNVTEIDYERSIRKRIGSNESIRHPDVFHTTQSLFIEEESVVNRYYYNAKGVVQKETVQTYFVFNENKDWILDSRALYSEADVIQVKANTTAETSSHTSRKKKRQKISHDEMDYVSPDESVEDDITTSKAGYNNSMHRVVSLQWYAAKGRSYVPSDKFVWKDSWFQGNYKQISVEQIIKKLLKIEKKKKKSRKKKIVHIRNAFNEDGKEVFTATVHTDKKEITLSSKIENLPTHGYCDSYVSTFANRENDIVSYYDSDANAKKAMIVNIFALSGYDLASIPIFNDYKGKANQCVALFEKKNKSSINFVTLLWSNDDGKFFFDFPNGTDLFDEWTTYAISL